ncbi:MULTISPECIES: HPP family protein [Vibrio]|uniref:HPP family protein n=1 Tax=Vibrio TaxID=662 RepID=UPI001EFEE000|nr:MULTISPECIES: HPP family protein [Vibrio]MCG9679127.1 HPP family protein [Vibrio sp. Isolate24]USD33806.1 HPP family protein [Vibrio sp. SCSIO 43186]USD46906.1 HPP family protein [Vibrio sp. SCSIO 43145]USD70930.1 HPP family protein [Vibrio sp. SCSIO 43139]USD95835.1 HPP family protein [Vibrio coralliilyticus]
MNHYLSALISGVGASLAIGFLLVLESNIENVMLVIAPFGATAVLVFGLPQSPLAQPKNVIMGHLITAIIGVTFSQYMDVNPMNLAIATGLGITCMLVSKTTHPPAGANPILIMLAGYGWSFLITPVLVGSIAIVFMSKTLQKIQSYSFNTER